MPSTQNIAHRKHQKNITKKPKKSNWNNFFYILFGETSKSIYHIVCDQKNMLVVFAIGMGKNTPNTTMLSQDKKSPQT